MPTLEDLTDQQREMALKVGAALLGNNKTRKRTKQMLKELDEKYTDPEIEIDARVAESLDALQKEREALKEERTKEKLQTEMNRIRARIGEMGLDFEEVEKFATENSMADLLKAAQWMQGQMQQADPTPPTLNIVNPVKEVQNLFHNPGKMKQERLAAGYQAVNEIMKGRRVG